MANKEFYSFDLYFQYQIKTFMYGGIEATMKKEALHLCALALSVYTEVLGGLVAGKLKEPRNEKKNYEAFLPYLGEAYVKLNDELKLHKMGGLYNVVRSKLVHEFSPRPSYLIRIYDRTTPKPGLEFSFGDSLPIDYKYKKELVVHYPAANHLTINIKEYYRDFKNGVENITLT